MALTIFDRIQELCENLGQKAPGVVKKSSDAMLAYLL